MDKLSDLWSVHPEFESHRVSVVTYWNNCFRYLFLSPNCKFFAYLTYILFIYIFHYKKFPVDLRDFSKVCYSTLSFKSSKPAGSACKIFVKNICCALFRHSMLTLYKPIVYYAKIDEDCIYSNKLTGGIIICDSNIYIYMYMQFPWGHCQWWLLKYIPLHAGIISLADLQHLLYSCFVTRKCGDNCCLGSLWECDTPSGIQGGELRDPPPVLSSWKRSEK